MINFVFHFNIYNDGRQNEVESIEEDAEARSLQDVKIWELQTEVCLVCINFWILHLWEYKLEVYKELLVLSSHKEMQNT